MIQISKEREYMSCHGWGATWGNTRISHEAKGKRGSMGKRLYCDFCRKEQVRYVSKLNTNLNSFNGPWGPWTVSSCLMFRIGVIRTTI